MMGSGKSTVGPLLAARTRRRFVDLDAELEDRVGRPVRAIFAADGEAAFRELERGLLAELLGSAEPLVLATGGGAVLAESNRRALHDAEARADATVVWLAADPTVLAARVGRDDARPL